MTIANTPANYKAAFSELIYTITNTIESRKIDVLIYDSEQTKTIGVKRLTGQQGYSVNVANYLQQQFDINPLTISRCAIVCESSRLKSVSVKVDELPVTAKSWHTFGAVDAQILRKLSNSPSMKKIAPRQKDEISFIAPGSTITASVALYGKIKNFSFSMPGITADHNIHSVAIDMDDIQHKTVAAGFSLADFPYMSVSVCADGIEFIKQNYEVCSPSVSTVRLCWVNRYGVIDYYSAASCKTRVANVSNRNIYGHDGFKSLGAQTQFLSTIISEYEPEQTMRWLCELIAAPKVWIVEDGQLLPVNIRSQSSTIASEELSRLELSVSPTTKTFSQKN